MSQLASPSLGPGERGVRDPVVNDMSIQVATVNGSGSQSANTVLLRTIFQMGVPVSGKNLFPSNIAGLPTWYTIRASKDGYIARKKEIDLLVAMNPETAREDVASLRPGSAVLYDAPLGLGELRSDLVPYAVPFDKLAGAVSNDAKLKKLLRNMVYVGVLARLLDLEMEEVDKAISKQFPGKAKALELNQKAARAGFDHAATIEKRDPFVIRRMDKTQGKIIIDGNAAAALGCVYGGATVCAWYPITPSSSVAEAFQKYCSKLRVDPVTGKNNYAIVQAEDEIASIGMVTGAGWNGARSFTATSGPGVSLMTEIIGLAYFAEIPVTIINVQRGGPSTGMPTRTQQADLISCAYASHGDTKHVMLFPQDPHECFEHAAAALDLADRLQTPIFVMTDLDIGMNQRLCEPFEWDDARRYDRGKVMTAEELEAGKEFARYKDVDGDGIPYRTLPGTHPSKGAYFTRGTTRDEYARYSEAGPHYEYNVQRLLKKFRTAAALVPQPIVKPAKRQTRLGVIYFGSTAPAMDEALETLAASGIHLDAMRLLAFPFPESVAQFVLAHDGVFVVEQNRDAQMRTLLVNELELAPSRLVPVLHYDGTPITARFITKTVTEHVHALVVAPKERMHS
jgi:2-oxoglutarate/2-oxoacid ferredoxin oxidoreductase subunit alpha